MLTWLPSLTVIVNCAIIPCAGTSLDEKALIDGTWDDLPTPEALAADDA